MKNSSKQPLRASMVGFDVTPAIHPHFGAWGTTPSMYVIDMPLAARCLALEHDGSRLVWYSSDAFGQSIENTTFIRNEVAQRLGLHCSQVIWSTSQTHAGGAFPGSNLVGNIACDLTKQDPVFAADQRKGLVEKYIDAGHEALSRLSPATVSAGRGFCDEMSYNGRLPMPTGGIKFTRHHGEGLQSGKAIDSTLGLVRFDNLDGKPIGVIFTFGCRLATLINDKYISPDWVGTARARVEDILDGAPAMFVQGFCADVNCYYMFGTPDHAKRTGTIVGRAVSEAMWRLVPVRGVPLQWRWRNVTIPCRPMYTRDEIDEQVDQRKAFIEEMNRDSTATWFCGVNLPDHFDVAARTQIVKVQIDYLNQARQRIRSGEKAPTSMDIELGAIRIGDVATLVCPGINFTLTGMKIRERSPFVHTLICGETNGIFGYIGSDEDIDRGGYETDSSWKIPEPGGFRLSPAKGASDRIIRTSIDLLGELRRY